MADPPPVVSVVIPTHNSAPTLRSTLSALSDQKYSEPFEVVVVDDHSTDDTDQVLNAPPLPVTVIRPNSRGAASARNAGARAARAGLLAFTDADCQPGPDWILEGVTALTSADIVQGRVVPSRPLKDIFERTLDVPVAAGLFESANLFVTRDLFERLGGFRQWIGEPGERPFGEDTLFGWRALDAGAEFAFSEAAVVEHVVFPGSWRSFMGERWRLRYFPPMVRRAPALRGHLWGSLFLTDRTARFDVAVVGVVLAIQRRSPLMLLATLPYIRWLYDHRHTWGWRRMPKLALAYSVADGIGLIALARGSLSSRTLVL